jgi:hypothetical protein
MVTESGSPADSTSAWSGRFLSVKRHARTTPNATEPATKERRPRSAVGMLSSSLRVNTLHLVFRVSEFEEVTEWQGSRRMRFGTKMRATRLAETCVRSAPKPQNGIVASQRTTTPLRLEEVTQAGIASMITNSASVGTTLLSWKPLFASNPRYSSVVRSFPPVSTSITRSVSFPVDGRFASDNHHSPSKSAPSAGTARRQLTRISPA